MDPRHAATVARLAREAEILAIRTRRVEEGWVEKTGSELTTLLTNGTPKVSGFDFQDFSDEAKYTGVPFEKEEGMFFFRVSDLPTKLR